MMITRTHSGVQFDVNIDKIKAHHTDKVFARLSDLLGEEISGVKLSGMWVLYRGTASQRTIIAGDLMQGHKRRSKLSLALAEALNIAIAMPV